MKVSRPRSLDLSNWSVDSRSSSLYTSSGSEESMAIRHNICRSVSRNNSSASRQLNGVCENSVVKKCLKNKKNVKGGQPLSLRGMKNRCWPILRPTQYGHKIS